jgi:hypothetical protein
MKKPGNSTGPHVMTGFHGVMRISSSFNGNYANTAVPGHVVAVAKSWTSNHYKSNQFACASYDPFGWFGTCQDQCPTAMTVSPAAWTIFPMASAAISSSCDRRCSCKGWAMPTIH